MAQPPPQKLARLRSDTQARWRTVWTPVRVCPWHTVSRRLKRTMSLTAFLPGPDSYLQSALSFFFFLSCKKKVRHTVWGRLFFLFHWLNYSLSHCHVFHPPSNNIFLVFFPLFSFSSAIPTFNHDYDASSRPPSAIHSAFLFIPFIFFFAHSLAAARLCQTHVVRPKHP